MTQKSPAAHWTDAELLHDYRSVKPSRKKRERASFTCAGCFVTISAAAEDLPAVAYEHKALCGKPYK